MHLRCRKWCYLRHRFLIPFLFVLLTVASSLIFSAASTFRLRSAIAPIIWHADGFRILDVESLSLSLPPSTAAAPLIVVLAVHLYKADRAAWVLSSWAMPQSQLLHLRIRGSIVGFVRIEPLFFYVSNEINEFHEQLGSRALSLPSNFSATMRTEHMLRYVAVKYPNLLWLAKADDDSIVHVGRLLRSLLSRNASTPMIVGHITGPYRFASGGAGYALSASAFNALVPYIDVCNNEVSGFRHTTMEDVMVTKCLRDVIGFGESVLIDDPGFNMFSPEQVFDAGIYVLAHTEVAPITHHYIMPEQAVLLLRPIFPKTLTQVVNTCPSNLNALFNPHGLNANQLTMVDDCQNAARIAGLDYALVAMPNAGSCGDVASLNANLRVLYQRGGIVIPLTTICKGKNMGDKFRSLLADAEAAGVAVPFETFEDTNSWALGSKNHGAAFMPLGPSAQDPHVWASSQYNHDVFRLLARLSLLADSAPITRIHLSMLEAMHVHVASTPLIVAVHGLWLGADVVLDELWFLSDVTQRAVGRILVPVSKDLVLESDALEAADVILIGGYGDRAAANAVALRYVKTKVTIFIASENTDGRQFDDQMVGNVAISFGHRREAPLPPPEMGWGPGAAYHRLPWWLPYTVRHETGGCVLPPDLYAASDDVAWLARPGFAALLSRHYGYPRKILFNLSSSLGRVDAPGKAFHNIEWPLNLPNHHLRGKIEFLNNYRFNICPENSLTRGTGGYNTEKLAQAHLAGTVPIYWGDAIDAAVFNPLRVIIYNGSNEEYVYDTINRLQNDERFRKEWFIQPILASTASVWLENWCTHAASIFHIAMKEIY
jgi:hypothetical protein